MRLCPYYVHAVFSLVLASTTHADTVEVPSNKVADELSRDDMTSPKEGGVGQIEIERYPIMFLVNEILKNNASPHMQQRHSVLPQRTKDASFIRFGRNSAEHSEPDEASEPEDPTPENAEDDVSLQEMGGTPPRDIRSHSANFVRFGRTNPNNFMRFGRGSTSFVRFGRGSPSGTGFVRFGKSGGKNFLRFGKKAGNDNFLRFG